MAPQDEGEPMLGQRQPVMGLSAMWKASQCSKSTSPQEGYLEEEAGRGRAKQGEGRIGRRQQQPLPLNLEPSHALGGLT